MFHDVEPELRIILYANSLAVPEVPFDRLSLTQDKESLDRDGLWTKSHFVSPRYPLRLNAVVVNAHRPASLLFLQQEGQGTLLYFQQIALFVEADCHEMRA